MTCLSAILAIQAVVAAPVQEQGGSEFKANQMRRSFQDLRQNLIHNGGGEELQGAADPGLDGAIVLVDWVEVEGEWLSIDAHLGISPRSGDRFIVGRAQASDESASILVQQTVPVPELESEALYWGLSGFSAGTGRGEVCAALRLLDGEFDVIDEELVWVEVELPFTSFFTGLADHSAGRYLEVLLYGREEPGAQLEVAFDDVMVYGVSAAMVQAADAFPAATIEQAYQDACLQGAQGRASLEEAAYYLSSLAFLQRGTARRLVGQAFESESEVTRSVAELIVSSRLMREGGNAETLDGLRDLAPPHTGRRVESFSGFEVGANLIACVLMIFVGVLWWASRPSTWLRLSTGRPAYKVLEAEHVSVRYRAFGFFLLSWFAWALAWVALAIGKSEPGAVLDRVAMIFGDANAFFLLGMYFSLTRGMDMSLWAIWRSLLTVGGAIVTALAGVYVIFDFAGNVGVLDQVWRLSSLCLAIIAPVVVGWAFRLRFQTRSIMVLGLVYGLSQPVVYATALPSLDSPRIVIALRQWQPAIVLTLACLKLAWGWWCTFLLHRAPMEHARSVLREPASRRGQTAMFLVSVGDPRAWPMSLKLLTALFITGLGLLASWALNRRMSVLQDTFFGLTTIIAVGTAIDVYVRALARFDNAAYREDT